MSEDRTTAALAKREAARDALADFESMLAITKSAFQEAMPKGSEATQLIRDAMHCMRLDAYLRQCSKSSLMGGLMTCAQLGLRPNVANLGQAWLVPLKTKDGWQASLWLGYRGMIKLAYNNARIETIKANVVREGELFRAHYEPAEIVHDPIPFGEGAPGKPIGYYAAARMARGGLVFDLLDEIEAEDIRQKVINGPNGRQKPWFSHPEAMKKKTAMRRMWRWLPISLETELVEAIDGSVRTDAEPNHRPEDMSQTIDGEIVDDNPLHGQADE